jgi:NAD(P)-dependent dehydrogenase (short-subunit alcohol dehydrogenase family)
MRLTGKVALVTGGGTGIGAAVARRFSREGAAVVVIGPDREPLEAVASEVGGAACVGDASVAADVRRAIGEATERFGGLDVLVANAGAEGFGALADVDEDVWERGVRANLTTCVVSAREALPVLVERGQGSIVIISSVAAITAGPGMVNYNTTKTALLGLTRALAVDYGPAGIRVNAVCPGWTRTQMAERAVQEVASRRGITVDEAWSLATRTSPLPRAADPDEIAAVCLFLASDEASAVTGATLVADCGQTVVNLGTVGLMES